MSRLPPPKLPPVEAPGGWALRVEALLTRIRPARAGLSLLVDALIVALTWQATYLFRLGFDDWFARRPDYDPLVLLGIVIVYAAAGVAFGVPRAVWRFIGFGEVQRLALVCLVAGAVSASAVQMAGLYATPRAVLALHPLMTLFGLAGVRIAYRMFYEHLRMRLSGRGGSSRRAIVLGAGDAARLLIAGIQHQGWTVVGLLDDDEAKQGSRVGNVAVIGRLERLRSLAELHSASHVIVAMPSLRREVRRKVFEQAASVGLPVLTVPSEAELSEGVAVSRVRDIEPEDLLGREPVLLDEAGIAEGVGGKVVLVTGAGGSIGSELCRQLARYGPARLLLLELSEFNLYAIAEELAERFPHLAVEPLIGDVRDLDGLRRLWAARQPQIVFHAAAYKHVPLMEEANAWQALRNNTLGTWQAGRVSAEHGVERFVLISTDKAVNPTNVMGASKRAAEIVLAHLAATQAGTRFMAVRFGNVLGSSGSVIPKFKAQIARGGPVTVTHPDITRYFMTIPEAARLVVQAAVLGESGRVYVLDMGEPVKIVDLAREMIRLAGHSLEEIPIAFSGLRPGEKLYEELLADADATLPTAIERLLVARIAPPAEAAPALLDWIQSRDSASPAEVRALLARVIPEYRPARH
ncbi:polysaccharide biosynthesis protein [Piscinibacter sp. Jin2]|uniref:Polysaccharide biosynthesis protein n=1 Tax=Aquariibacter lacus TaxID=2801332 RepID=A0A9X0XEY8_9BURK|nr:nucleoside-diphosphate sugar epimerase/dehydratase [Piscinibacter lacus]MBL0720689.1 polysaccharide biosynthesis protein [Piscinibacter lacus]